ncbi:hypothetical protein A3A66_02760 [Microgenomates group bacterium RIFCSPLOWO2_01_FULL_46_13]|nr:MAG: hypothetical protein A2783_00145 [Microgenomates group bacterium RIFCSPHIGHO2_01_FULL_45_11]OGV94888.1 MAG: hypothetical protein A3A66_02760 [Microgenomates group bacterium RIFCSPLOWO2_01_FULL_46_13]
MKRYGPRKENLMDLLLEFFTNLLKDLQGVLLFLLSLGALTLFLLWVGYRIVQSVFRWADRMTNLGAAAFFKLIFTVLFVGIGLLGLAGLIWLAVWAGQFYPAFALNAFDANRSGYEAVEQRIQSGGTPVPTVATIAPTATPLPGSTPTPAAAAALQLGRYLIQHESGTADLRAGPGGDSDLLAEIPNGSTVTVLEFNPGDGYCEAGICQRARVAATSEWPEGWIHAVTLGQYLGP